MGTLGAYGIDITAHLDRRLARGAMLAQIGDLLLAGLEIGHHLRPARKAPASDRSRFDVADAAGPEISIRRKRKGSGCFYAFVPAVSSAECDSGSQRHLWTLRAKYA